MIDNQRIRELSERNAQHASEIATLRDDIKFLLNAMLGYRGKSMLFLSRCL